MSKIDETLSKESPNLKHLHRAKDRLKSAWMNQEASHQVFLSFVTKDQVKTESKKFQEKKDKYEPALEQAKESWAIFWNSLM